MLLGNVDQRNSEQDAHFTEQTNEYAHTKSHARNPSAVMVALLLTALEAISTIYTNVVTSSVTLEANDRI